MGEERGVYNVLVGKPEGKSPLGRPRRRCVYNIRMDLQQVGCGYMDWIGLAQDRDRWRTLVSAVMNLRVPWNAGNFLTSYKPVSFLRGTLHHGVSKFKGQQQYLTKQITRLIVSAVKRSFRNKNRMRRDVSQIRLLNSGNNSRYIKPPLFCPLSCAW